MGEAGCIPEATHCHLGPGERRTKEGLVDEPSDGAARGRKAAKMTR
jgi:hypothetical protein